MANINLSDLLDGGGGGYTIIATEEFSASGTWTKPAGAKFVRIICFGGGAGGGSQNNNSSTNPRGGNGGMIAMRTIPADALSATETVTVGAGGAGTASGGGSQAGGAGGDSSFGDLVKALGGNVGTAASATDNFNNTDFDYLALPDEVKRLIGAMPHDEIFSRAGRGGQNNAWYGYNGVPGISAGGGGAGSHFGEGAGSGGGGVWFDYIANLLSSAVTGGATESRTFNLGIDGGLGGTDNGVDALSGENGAPSRGIGGGGGGGGFGVVAHAADGTGSSGGDGGYPGGGGGGAGVRSSSATGSSTDLSGGDGGGGCVYVETWGTA